MKKNNLNFQEYRGCFNRKTTALKNLPSNQSGEYNGNHKLTMVKVKIIRFMFNSSISKKTIRHIFKISRQHLNAILSHKIWN